MDIGYSNFGCYMFGICFGDFDYYVFFGEDLKNILDSYMVVIGCLELKLCYVLGYY